jgi:GntR family transcriptional regulator, transcriptional repressor for pyruvate dehydrogenase complex
MMIYAILLDKMSDQFSGTNQFEDSPYLNPINQTLVVDQVIDRLVALIVNENLKPGDKLPTERELMARLAVGRSSLREAIKTLSAVGALEVKRGSGIFVGYGDTSILAKPLAWGMFLSGSNVGQVIESRSVIEVALAGWAADRRTEEDLANLSALLDNLEKSQNDKMSYIEYDLKFHLAIGKAAQNNILFQVLTIFQHLLRVWMEITYKETQGPRDSMKTHRELFEAIRAGNSLDARRIMQKHTSGSPLRSALDRQYAESQITLDFLSFIKESNQ